MLGFLYCAHGRHRQQGRLHFLAAETSLTSGTAAKKFSLSSLRLIPDTAAVGGRT
jgi:hypothetical protein